MNRELNARSILKVLKRKKLPEFKNISEVCEFVTEFLLERYDLEKPIYINNGYCFIWAYLVWALWDHVEFCTADDHVVVKVDDLYYDSVNPEGCADADLMCGDCELVHTNVYGMAWFWTKVGLCKDEFKTILFNTNRKLHRDLKAGAGDWDVTIYDIPETY